MIGDLYGLLNLVIQRQKFPILRQHTSLWTATNLDSSLQDLYVMVLAIAFRAARRVNS